MGVEDDLRDAYLFNIKMVPRWSEDLIPLLTIGQLNIPKPLQERQIMVQKSSPFVMLAGQMYNKGQDGVLRLCIEPEEKPYYLKMAHETIGGIHMAGNQTLKRLLWVGVWWPSMKTEAHSYVLSCKECGNQPPKPFTTLFQVMVAPKWSSYIVDYL